MGACYSVEYKLYPKNEKECEKALREYVKKIRNGCLGEVDQNQEEISMDGLLRFVLCADRAGSNYERISEHHYSSSFDASYGWERVLADAFIAMAPCLKDGSYASIEPDEYPYTIALKDGQCICIDGRASHTG